MQEKKVPQYDAGYKEELSKKEEFVHFLKKYVRAPWAINIGPEDVELCDKEFVLEDYKKRSADLVYRIHVGDVDIYCYLIMELQSSVDFTMPFRLETYMFSLHLKVFLEEKEAVRSRMDYRLPVVVPILFYNGEHPWTAVTRFAQYQNGFEIFGGHVMDFEYYLVDLTQITDDYILNSNKLIDNILALDKNKKSGPKLTEILEQIEIRLQELTEDEQVSFGKWLEYVLLATARGAKEESVRLLIEKLKGDAHLMIHGLQQVILNEYDAGFEKGNEQGFEKGNKQGFDEGIAQGIRAGIEALVSDNMEMGASEEQIVIKIQKYFNLDEKIAGEYFREVKMALETAGVKE